MPLGLPRYPLYTFCLFVLIFTAFSAKSFAGEEVFSLFLKKGENDTGHQLRLHAVRDPNNPHNGFYAGPIESKKGKSYSIQVLPIPQAQGIHVRLREAPEREEEPSEEQATLAEFASTKIIKGIQLTVGEANEITAHLTGAETEDQQSTTDKTLPLHNKTLPDDANLTVIRQEGEKALTPDLMGISGYTAE